MKLKRIGKIAENTKYVTLPKEWGNIGEYVDTQIVSENELKLVRVKVTEMVNGAD